MPTTTDPLAAFAPILLPAPVPDSSFHAGNLPHTLEELTVEQILAAYNNPAELRRRSRELGAITERLRKQQQEAYDIHGQWEDMAEKISRINIIHLGVPLKRTPVPGRYALGTETEISYFTPINQWRRGYLRHSGSGPNSRRYRVTLRNDQGEDFVIGENVDFGVAEIIGRDWAAKCFLPAGVEWGHPMTTVTSEY